MSKLITPEQYALANTEASHQIALFMWASQPDVRAKYPELEWMFAIPNGEFRTKATGARLKAMGVKKGILDILLPVKRSKWGGLWIEMKIPKGEGEHIGRREGHMTPEQKRFGEFVQKQGYGVCKCHTWDQAKYMIETYLDYK